MLGRTTGWRRSGDESTSFDDSLDTDPLSSASGESSKRGGTGGRRKGMDSDLAVSHGRSVIINYVPRMDW